MIRVQLDRNSLQNYLQRQKQKNKTSRLQFKKLKTYTFGKACGLSTTISQIYKNKTKRKTVRKAITFIDTKDLFSQVEINNGVSNKLLFLTTKNKIRFAI